ncbi:MAG: prolyl oligopeptidase family serine peptidase [Cytophagales bacterium]|nr:prolyl oligopeptidase family serine peptidase [Cytophagales bacterium]
MKHLKLLILLVMICHLSIAQEVQGEIEQLRNQVANLRHSFDIVRKQLDDVLWYDKVGDVAYIDKVYLTGPPKADRVEKNKTRQGYGNPFRFQSYVFIPKGIDPSKKYPLLVLPHGGVHSNFNTYYTHIIRELMAQQYIVVAAEYRGSTGYGRGFYQSIDYGGLEVEDVYASRNYMVENYDIVDESRIGIFGWSHGGLITLMNIFDHPKDYKVAYAGVPVSDLIARMGYKTQGYRDLYSVDYHIGKSAYADVEEYKKRSPAWQAHKLETPLLIHTNTNDADVNVLEVEHLIKSLKAEGKKFEYEIYQDIPGGHSFDRIDSKKAQEVRLKIYKFLGGYLNPPKKFNSVKDLRKAAYRF